MMLSWDRKSPSLQNKSDTPYTKNERNREIDSLASDLEDIKKFVRVELFALKTCVETVKSRRTDQNFETTDKQKSLNWRQD